MEGPSARPARVLRAAACAAVLAAAPAYGGAESGRTYDFQDPLWDDGYAEMSVYRATRVIYGKPRPHELRLVVVKEDLDPRTYVKSDLPGPDAIPVMKLIYAAQVPTDSYPYQFFASVFVRREDPWEPLKASSAVHEWCGVTTHFLRGWLDPAQLEFRSYFDGEADGLERVSIESDVLLEDQLPLALRALPRKPGYRREIRLLPSLLSNRHAPWKARWAILEMTGPTSSTAPWTKPAAGGADDAIRMSLAVDGVSQPQIFAFEAKPPHGLLWFQAGGDETLVRAQRTNVARTRYWERPPAVKKSR